MDYVSTEKLRSLKRSSGALEASGSCVNGPNVVFLSPDTERAAVFSTDRSI